MKTVGNVVTGYFKNSQFDIEPLSDQDILNLTNLINHFIQDKNSGRAYFGNISNDKQVSTEFMAKHTEAAHELISVRKTCENCRASEFKNCPYNKKMLKNAKKYEKDKGLTHGTINIKKISARPTLITRQGKFIFGYESCPILNG